MLILVRKENEKVLMPALGITITVCRLKGDKVCLGIDAPREVEIQREEVLQRILLGQILQAPPAIAADLVLPPEPAGRVLAS
jgi:carbon storage regulator